MVFVVEDGAMCKDFLAPDFGDNTDSANLWSSLPDLGDLRNCDARSVGDLALAAAKLAVGFLDAEGEPGGRSGAGRAGVLIISFLSDINPLVNWGCFSVVAGGTLGLAAGRLGDAVRLGEGRLRRAAFFDSLWSLTWCSSWATRFSLVSSSSWCFLQNSLEILTGSSPS